MEANLIIERIEIRNFQSIGYADMQLAEWVSIVGESDLGKSAILRAVRAAMVNRRGDDPIRHGAKAAEVTLYLTAGPVVTWRKERGKSGVYVVARPGEPPRTYEKTAGEVPEGLHPLRPNEKLLGLAALRDVGGDHHDAARVA